MASPGVSFSNHFAAKGESCAICLQEHQEKTIVLAHNGIHPFHPNCLKQWKAAQLEKGLKVSCPLCKSRVTTINRATVEPGIDIPPLPLRLPPSAPR
jgi:hypothetical protein